jgi:hypothetical protein
LGAKQHISIVYTLLLPGGAQEMATSTGIIEEAIYKILPQLVMNELKAGFTSSQRYWRNYMIKCASIFPENIFIGQYKVVKTI